MAYSPTTIANYFIKKYGKIGDLSPMKLLKLTYISYGFYMAITDGQELLIDEKPAAWDYGPVFPSLYINIKRSYTSNNIKKVIPNTVEENIDTDTAEFLDKIWKLYGRYDGVYLSALTHQEGTPWKKFYKPGLNVTIPDQEILTHYKDKLKDS